MIGRVSRWTAPLGPDQGQSDVFRPFPESFVVSFVAAAGFELAGGTIAETGVEALVVRDIINETLQMGLGLRERLVVVQIHLLAFEGGEKAFGQRVLIRIPDGGHADLGATLLQPRDIAGAGVLHPMIGMVDQARRRSARG